MKRNYIFNIQGLEMFQISNFLSDDECSALCSLIEKDNRRSTVVNQEGYSEQRTSRSCFFNEKKGIVTTIENRIARELNIPIEYSEPMQGQLYTAGEFFGDHPDYFDGEAISEQAVSGQRTWTAMIYLNKVSEGGHTEFPLLGKSFPPIKGSVLFWKNSDGTNTVKTNAVIALNFF